MTPPRAPAARPAPGRGFYAVVIGELQRAFYGAPEQVEAEQAAPGYHDNKDAVLKRLRRVEGQIRGLQRLLQEVPGCRTGARCEECARLDRAHPWPPTLSRTRER